MRLAKPFQTHPNTQAFRRYLQVSADKVYEIDVIDGRQGQVWRHASGNYAFHVNELSQDEVPQTRPVPTLFENCCSMWLSLMPACGVREEGQELPAGMHVVLGQIVSKPFGPYPVG